VSIAEDLSRVVRKNWLAVALRAAHLPAQAAGFGVLQSFLERGFRAFRQMGDARELLMTIRQRETALMESLLRGDQSAIADIAQRTTARV
jgi:glutathionylspermidine synthase